MIGNSRILLKKSIFLLIPVALSPLLLFGKELRCVFVILLMSLFWLTDILPIGITSFLPLVLFPFLEISEAKRVSQNYFKDNIVLFVASLIMAMAVEETQLHRRIALSILNFVGAGKLQILAGIMATTAFVSFFISDTAATTLMLPIAIAILSSLQDMKMSAENEMKKDVASIEEEGPRSQEELEITGNSSKDTENRKKTLLDFQGMTKTDRGFCKAIVLAVSQASLIGGTGIITGTGTNLVFKEQILDFYPGTEVVSYVQWMTFALPFVPFYLFASGLILTAVLMPGELLPCWKRGEKEIMNKTTGMAMKTKIKEAYVALGRISFGETSVLFFLLFLLSALCSKSPGFVNGWENLLPHNGKYVEDSTVAMTIAVLLFFWPRDPFHDEKFSPILEWNCMKERFPWSCMLLIGAGLAISEGVKDSGLGNMIACGMKEHFKDFNVFWMQVLATFLACFITEFASNVAAAGILVPIMISLSQGFQLNPLYLVLPVTISCSFSFMFPMATPGNAIVYDTKIVSLSEMMLVGILLNIACISITVLNFNTYAFWFMQLGEVSSVAFQSHLLAVCGGANSTKF